MRTPVRAVILTLTIMAIAPSLGAQGFKPFELGARAATLGGAFVARADDASAVYFNPAGLAFQPGLRLKIDLSYNIMSTTAEVPGSAKVYKSEPGRFMGQPYVALNIKDFITFGIGIFSANTMKTFWPDNQIGNIHADESSVATTYVRPALAVKISRSLALGAGVDFITASQAWNTNKTFTFAASPGRVFPARVRTNVEGRGIGFVGGWLFKPSERFGIGGKYTSRVEIDLQGTTDLDNVLEYFQTLRGLSTRAKTAMPEEIVVGLMAAPLKNLSVHLDYQRIGMSGAMDWMFDVDARVYDDIESLAGLKPDADSFGAGLVLKNTSRIMCGIEYVLSNALAVRAGYSRQESSVDDTSLQRVFPDLAMDVLSLGLGYEGPFFDLIHPDRKMGGLSVDASFQYGLAPNRTSQNPDFPALFKGNRWSFGVGFGFVF